MSFLSFTFAHLSSLGSAILYLPSPCNMSSSFIAVTNHVLGMALIARACDSPERSICSLVLRVCGNSSLFGKPRCREMCVAAVIQEIIDLFVYQWLGQRLSVLLENEGTKIQ